MYILIVKLHIFVVYLQIYIALMFLLMYVPSVTKRFMNFIHFPQKLFEARAQTCRADGTIRIPFVWKREIS
jgi:hypothetical protein